MTQATESASEAQNITTTSIDGWELARVGGEEEPRVRDVDLAERLEYERPRKIRDIIERLKNEGKLNDFDLRPTVGRRREPGMVAAIPVTTYYLTEEAALLVTSQSGTAKAWAITRELVRVFVAARRMVAEGRSRSAAPSFDASAFGAAVAGAVGAAIGPILEDMRETLQTMRAPAPATSAPTLGAEYSAPIGHAGADTIRSRLKLYGQRMAPGEARRWNKWRSQGELELREHLGHFGSGKTWESLPHAKFFAASAYLDKMLNRAAMHAGDRQLEMPLASAIQATGTGAPSPRTYTIHADPDEVKRQREERILDAARRSPGASASGLVVLAGMGKNLGLATVADLAAQGRLANRGEGSRAAWHVADP